MKNLFLITLLSLFSFTPKAFANEIAHITVNGMVCDFCARALEITFKDENAVDHININLDTQTVSVFFKDGQTVTNEQLEYLITDSGYDVDSILREK